MNEKTLVFLLTAVAFWTGWIAANILDDDIPVRPTYRSLQTLHISSDAEVDKTAYEFMRSIDRTIPNGRAKDNAIDSVEEALFWARRGIEIEEAN